MEYFNDKIKNRKKGKFIYKEAFNMSDFVLACATTADMPKSFYIERNIEYIYFHFLLDDKQYDDDFGESYPFSDFYQRIADGGMPTTCQINVDEHMEFFEKFLKEGKDVLFVSLSSGISGSFNSCQIAANELKEKYPERKLRVVDSLAASAGYGLFMDELYRLKEAGKSIDEVYEWAEENKLNVHHWFFTSDLTHLKRGGRVSASSAVLGTILGICPLMNVSFEGKLIPRKKIRGKKTVIKETVKMMEECAYDKLSYNGNCYISHSACLEDAIAVKDLIEEKFPQLKGKVQISDIGAVIGSHTGKGTVALFFMGDKRID